MLFRDPGAEVALRTGFKRGHQEKRACQAHLKKQPWCIACESRHKGLWAAILRIFRRVRVHHIYPFHIVRALDREDLECDPRNLVTLCWEHHRVLGHFNDWDSYNPHVKHLALRFFGRPAEDIMKDLEWLRFRDERKHDIRFLTVAELLALRSKLDEKFPPQS